MKGNNEMGWIRTIIFELTKLYYPYRIKKKAKVCAGKICVGGKSYVTTDTEFGNNVITLGGLTIREGVIIQAGSVVCKDIPAYAIA